MPKNDDWYWITLFGCGITAIIIVLIIQYKTNIAFIEAGYSQDANNRWVKPTNCNCPPNNSQHEQN